jgi:putative flavoprotein involved in K+ transport
MADSEAAPARHAGRAPSEHANGVQVPGSPRSLDLDAAGIATAIWATGYRREYPWLHVDALDPTGELIHERGITPVLGLYALGLKFQYRRSSHLIGGVGHDAAFIAEHISGRVRAPARQA